MDKKTKKLVLTALFLALVTVATMVIRIPIPATQGYFNLGDSLIFTAAAILGPVGGLVAGGIGSALADVLGGYANWAIFTLIIKGLEGLIAGYFCYQLSKKDKKGIVKAVVGMLIAAIWMVAGYFVVGGFMYGFAPASVEIPFNLLQGGLSVVVAVPLSIALGKILPGDQEK